jgi:hypothetical protein
MDDFPELNLRRSVITVHIEAVYEVTDRNTANEVERQVREALEILRQLGTANVFFQVEEGSA